MLMRTHLALGMFGALFILEHVYYKFSFILLTLIATILPDIDSAFSSIGKTKLFRPLQFVTKHRGLLHSFSFCVVISVFLAFYFPIYALPFFLGYGLHLLADSFTIDGIRPFWPFKYETRGFLRVGSPVETALFIGFVLIDVLLIIELIIG